MAQTVLQQVLILSAMMMLGFLLGKLGKVDRKGADLLSMLLLDVFFPCNEKEHVDRGAGHGKRAEHRSLRAEHCRAERNTDKSVIRVGNAAGKNKCLVLIQPNQLCDRLCQNRKQDKAGQVGQHDLDDL